MKSFGDKRSAERGKMPGNACLSGA